MSLEFLYSLLHLNLEVLVDVQGLLLRVNAADRGVGMPLILWGEYSALETTLVLKSLSVGAVFYDVGANVGIYTLLAARVVGPSGRVLAFEPNPRNVRLLRLNVALNGFTNTEVLPVALSDRAGAAPLFVDSRNWGKDSLIAANVPPSERSEAVEVEIRTLDEAIANGALPLPDFIKIDVEGAELSVISGAKSMLDSDRDVRILAEVWPRVDVCKSDTFTEILRSHHYDVAVVDKTAHVLRPLTARDAKQVFTVYARRAYNRSPPFHGDGEG